MAPKKPDNSAAPLTPTPVKSTKDGVVRRTPVKRTPAKTTPAKITSNSGQSIAERDLLFLWVCVQCSGGVDLNVPAVAKEMEMSTTSIGKKFWRLRKKLEDARSSQVADEQPQAEENEAEE